MKTDREAKAIQKFCEHMKQALESLSYNACLEYCNESETIKIKLNEKKVTINVYASSLKAVFLDFMYQMEPLLLELNK